MVLEGTQGDSTNKAFKVLKNKLTSHEMIKQVSSTQDALVGTFKGKDNRTAFLITNFDDPANNKKNTIELELFNATKALIYHFGEAKEVELTNHKLTYELDPGDGIFVIPYK